MSERNQSVIIDSFSEGNLIVLCISLLSKCSMLVGKVEVFSQELVSFFLVRRQKNSLTKAAIDLLLRQ